MSHGIVSRLRVEFRNSGPQNRYKNLARLLRYAGNDHKLEPEEIVAETKALLTRYWAEGSRDVMGMLITLNAGIAGKVAQRHLGKSPDLTCKYHDLMQEALTGLLFAVQKFDPERGVPFGSFAYSTINYHLLHYRRNRKGLVKVPQIWGEKYSKVMRATQRGGNKQSPLDVAIGFGIKPDLWEKIEAAHSIRVGTLTEEVDVPVTTKIRVEPF